MGIEKIRSISPEGTSFGQGTEKISFYGVSPVARQAFTATVTTTATTTALATDLAAVVTVLENLGLMS